MSTQHTAYGLEYNVLRGGNWLRGKTLFRSQLARRKFIEEQTAIERAAHPGLRLVFKVEDEYVSLIK